VTWCPEEKLIATDKMLCASSKDAIKKKPTDVVEIHANDLGDLAWDMIMARLRS